MPSSSSSQPNPLGSTTANTSTTTNTTTAKYKPPQRRRRSVSLCSNASLDEFGRVKRRRPNHTSDDDQDADHDLRRSRYDDRRRGRWERRRSRSRSPENGKRYYEEAVGRIERSRSRSSSPPRTDGFYKRSIHVSELPFDVTHGDLRDHFASAGKVLGVKLFLHKPSRYGFITFSTSEGAQRAIDEMDGTYIMDACIRVSRARVPEPVRKGSHWQDLDGGGDRGYSTPDSLTAAKGSGASGSGDPFDELLMEYSSMVKEREKETVETKVVVPPVEKKAEEKPVTKVRGEDESEEGEVLDEDA
ncbi:hypothetical protein HDU67_000971 [Dinochytrium kinnereticum]|nr:hypothetical protein HDU67_000971 [Dinochytrium kinnereticum]